MAIDFNEQQGMSNRRRLMDIARQRGMFQPMGTLTSVTDGSNLSGTPLQAAAPQAYQGAPSLSTGLSGQGVSQIGAAQMPNLGNFQGFGGGSGMAQMGAAQMPNLGNFQGFGGGGGMGYANPMLGGYGGYSPFSMGGFGGLGSLFGISPLMGMMPSQLDPRIFSNAGLQYRGGTPQIGSPVDDGMMYAM